MLPVLYLAQREWGYISHEAMRYVADLLEVPPARVAGVVSFYTMFRTAPAGKYVIEVCSSLPCSLMGSEHVVAYLERKLGIEVEGTTSDGRFTLTKVECLAACGTAPVMMVNGDLCEDLTEEKIDGILARLIHKPYLEGITCCQNESHRLKG